MRGKRPGMRWSREPFWDMEDGRPGRIRPKKRERGKREIVRPGFRTMRPGRREARWGFGFLKVGVPAFPPSEKKKYALRQIGTNVSIFPVSTDRVIDIIIRRYKVSRKALEGVYRDWWNERRYVPIYCVIKSVLAADRHR
jgi:hypothetical protein